MTTFEKLQPFRDEILKIFNEKGTTYTKNYVYRKYKVKMKARELRQFLNVPSRHKEYKLSQQAHKIAWESACWKVKRY